MARLEGLRERIAQMFFDTAVASGVAGGDVEFSDHLFGNRNIGQWWFTNMRAGGYLPGDQTFIIKRVITRVWADKGGLVGAKSFLDEVAARVHVQLVVGDKPQATVALLPDYEMRGFGVGADVDGRSDVRVYSYALDPNIHIPPRQGFYATLAGENLKELFNGFEGRKLFQVWLDGVLTRDVQ